MNKNHAYALGLFSLLISLSLWGCSSGTNSGGTTGSAQSQIEAVNGRCPSSPSLLHGTKNDGASCVTYADCEPSCCSCTGSGSWLAAACINGICTSKTTTCEITESDSVCSGTTSSSSSSTTSSSGSTTSSSSSSSTTSSSSTSSSGSSGDFTQCVDGQSYECQYVAQGKWTGSSCCVDSALHCGSGQSYECQYIAQGKWTGDECCLPSVSYCTSGDSYNCQYVAHGKWTGTECCF